MCFLSNVVCIRRGRRKFYRAQLCRPHQVVGLRMAGRPFSSLYARRKKSVVMLQLAVRREARAAASSSVAARDLAASLSFLGCLGGGFSFMRAVFVDEAVIGFICQRAAQLLVSGAHPRDSLTRRANCVRSPRAHLSALLAGDKKAGCPRQRPDVGSAA